MEAIVAPLYIANVGAMVQSCRYGSVRRSIVLYSVYFVVAVYRTRSHAFFRSDALSKRTVLLSVVKRSKEHSSLRSLLYRTVTAQRTATVL